MKGNNSGFSMIELLAAIVVLGILMGIAVPTVMTVMSDQRNKTYVEDAIRLASNMEYKMNSDNMMMVPARGSCIAVSLAYLDNNTFNDAPYDGEYDRQASFVVMKRNTDKYSDTEYFYYVRLIEKTKTGAYRGIDLIPVDDDGDSATGTSYLYMDKAIDHCVSNIGSSNVNNLTDFSVYNLRYKLNTNYGISCTSVAIYAPVA